MYLAHEDAMRVCLFNLSVFGLVCVCVCVFTLASHSVNVWRRIWLVYVHTHARTCKLPFEACQICENINTQTRVFWFAFGDGFVYTTLERKLTSPPSSPPASPARPENTILISDMSPPLASCFPPPPSPANESHRRTHARIRIGRRGLFTKR